MLSPTQLLRSVFTAAIALSVACSDHATAPLARQSNARAATSLAATPPANASLLTIAQRARLDSLRASLAWIGDLHHQAMQEALHDPAAGTFTSRGPGSPACLAQIRYAERYTARADSMAAARGLGVHQPADDPTLLASRVGVCRSTNAPSTQTVFGPYATSMIAALRRARTLPQALAAIDEQLTLAAADPGVGAEQLTSLVALGTLAASSATEWFDYAAGGRVHGSAIRIASASRSSAMSTHAEATDMWISDAMASDADGCASSSGTSSGCVIGGIAGSIFSW